MALRTIAPCNGGCLGRPTPLLLTADRAKDRAVWRCERCGQDPHPVPYRAVGRELPDTLARELAWVGMALAAAVVAWEVARR